jgi:hypothetical protein
VIEKRRQRIEADGAEVGVRANEIEAVAAEQLRLVGLEFRGGLEFFQGHRAAILDAIEFERFVSAENDRHGCGIPFPSAFAAPA